MRPPAVRPGRSDPPPPGSRTVRTDDGVDQALLGLLDRVAARPGGDRRTA